MAMYKMIGGDGKEYGPFSLEQLQQWHKEGRINSETPLQAEGGAEWKPLKNIPEAAAAMGCVPPPASNIPPVTSTSRQKAENIANAILARDYSVNIGSCLSRGWALVKANFWLTVGVTTLIAIILGISNYIFIGLLLTGVLTGGLYYFILKLIRGQPAALEDAFVGFKLSFAQLMLVGLVSGILTSVGLFLCILPGIYLGVAWSFAIPLVIDKQLEFWDAMEVSRKVISKHWWQFFALLLVLGLVAMLGLIACFIGVFVTITIALASMAYAYEDIFAEPSSKTP
ncbi:MAG: GYF domain-containing protein [Verrucomicrobiae bacterium]|nr:GYF domain-containing protein [Verrucomicrobiae bacterium]